MMPNGLEKIKKQMTDREYAEIADIPENMLYEEIFDEEYLVDEDKDIDYYSNRISKGYGLVDNKIKYQNGM